MTELLLAWSSGNRAALDKLTPLVYDELKRLAGRYLKGRHQTLQPTALVNEAFVQLMGLGPVEWTGRAHFIGLAARMMRCVLVDHARKQAAEKRGGGAIKVTISRAEIVSGGPALDLVALDDAFELFSRSFPRQARTIELYFFGGLETSEIPAVLQTAGFDVSQRTVERDLQFAKAWLRKEMGA